MEIHGRKNANGEGRRKQGQAGAKEQAALHARRPDDGGNRDRHGRII
jgi:hypothetical protein